MQKLRVRRSLFVLLLVSLTIISASGQENSPQIDATLQDALLVDRDRDGRLDAGDTLGYTLEITNCSTVAAENVQITGQVDPNTRFNASSVQVNAPRPATNCPPQPNPTNPVAVVSADTPLVVQATAPANGATEVATNASIVLQFNRTVAVAGDWFALVCTASGTFRPSAGNVILTSDGINLILDPVLDLVPGETCTVTVFAANVSGSDPNAPGSPMAADYVFSFTTATTETAPTITATNPVNGEAAFVSTADIVITFSEPVTVSEASFTLECPVGTPTASGFVVSGSGTSTVTINPNDTLPAGVTCTVVVIAANVSDADANDPPNLLDGNGDTVEGDNYTFSFSTTADAAPTVQTIAPANGAVSVPNNTPIQIDFSESVDIASPAAFGLQCGVTPIAFTVTTPAALPASATTFVLTPDSALPDGETCTVTVVAAQVADTDTLEPPDTMAADFTATFTTEAPPTVTTTSPANGAAGIATDSSIVVDFSEPVNVSTSSFTIECPAGGTSYTYSLSGSGSASVTLIPDTRLPAGETCTVTVIAGQVSDTDAIDPPDTMVANTAFSFSTIVDAVPTVQTIAPANGAVDVPINATLQIDFSESVDIAGPAAFGLQCGVTPIAFTVTTPAALPASATTFILTPSSALPAGSPCTVTVFAAQVTDTDLDDPPNTMAADFTATFTTEAPPTVTTTSPANAATGIANTTDIVLTFSEPVTVSAASFALECPATVPFASGFAVSGSGTSTITINPTGSLPAGITCTVVVIAANVSDVDGNDPPDLLDGNGDLVEGDDYSFSFTTEADSAPTVLSITPANGAISVPANTTITITFSELVDIASAGDFALECASLPQGYTVTTPATLPASTTTVVITPASNLPGGTACTVTVFGTFIPDSDADDPPDTMAANVSATFTIEAPPSVTGTTPTNGATGVSTSADIVITFSEPVTISGPTFSMFCGPTPIITTNFGSGTNTITLDPVANLPANENCTVTVVAAQVSDTDLVDPPDQMLANYVFSFATVADTAPVASSPLDGATNVAPSSNIVINFNEPVDVTAGAFTLECLGSPVAFTIIPALPTTNQNSITLDPSGALPSTATCSVSVLAANVTDTDSDEPPNNMALDYSFTFNTTADLAPTVVQASIVPASTSTGANSASLNSVVSTTPTITIPFSEAIDAASGAFTLFCNASPITISTTPALPALGQTSIDVAPLAPLTEGVNCVLTVVAANISDSDLDEPPNQMAANFVLSFSVDTAPSALLTETEVGGVFQNVTGAGAVNVDLDSNIRITFTEAVTVTFPANGLQCPSGNNIPVTVTTNNAATIVLNPNANLPLNTLCSLNIPAANISDVDTGDAPDTPSAAVTHSFTTVDDDAPTVSTNPANGGSNVAVNSNITVIFNESVTLTGAWFALDCSVSGSRVSTGELTGTGITIIENTPDLVYTIDPAVDFAVADTCTITIDSANAVDNDPIDPPNELDGDASADIVDGDADDYVATFSTVDVPPQVTSTIPLAAAINVPANQTVTINFSETVDIAAGGITFTCDAAPVAFTPSLPLSNVTSITLTPASALPLAAACVVTLESTLITDDDTVDPPNFLDGDSSGDLIDDADNFVLNFTVVPPQAIDDAYTITPHLTYVSSAAALGVRDNDAPATVTITGFGPTVGTANGMAPNGTNFITAGGAGGRVVLNADGTFIFYPDAGDTAASGTATFFYTITGGDTAQVTLTFEAEELVWFAEQFPPASAVCTLTNTGTQACPAPDFVSLIAPNLTTADILFIDSGVYQCGITLPNGVLVIGNGSSSTLQALSGVSPVAGSDFAPYNALNGVAPTLNSLVADCFTLGQNNTVRGLTIASTPNGHAFQDNGGTIGTATITEVTISNSGGIFNLANGGTLNATLNAVTSTSSPSAPILLTNIAGTITQTGGGTITNTGNFDLMDVNGGAVVATLSANFNSTGGNGSVVDVSGGHTGTLTFAGTVSSGGAYTGDNVQFDNADGTYNFNGNLALLAGSAGVNIQNGSGGTFAVTSASSDIQGIQGIPFRINNSAMAVNYDGDITHRQAEGSLLSARVIEIIAGTGVISFDGTIAVGTAGVGTRATAPTVFLQNTGNANTITFNYVDSVLIDTPAFISSVSGNVVMNRLRVNCDGNLGADNHCIDIADTASSNFTIETIRADHDDVGESGGAISLVNTPGTWTIEDTTLGTGSGGIAGRDAVMVYGLNFGTLNFATVDSATSPGGVISAAVTANNRPAFDLTNGTINLSMTALDVFSTTTSGVRLSGVSGTGMTVSGNTLLDLTPASTGYGILIENASAGAYNFSTAGTVSITDRTNEGIFLNNVDSGSVAFGNTTINNPSAATEAAVRAENGSSGVTFAQANINQGNVGTHEGFVDEFTPQDNSGSGDAIYFKNMTGGLTINGGTITNVRDDGIDIRTSQNLVLNNVTISNTGLSPGADCVGCNSSAVQGYELSGTNVMTNLNVSSGRIRNFYLSNTTGSTTLNFTNSTLNDTRSAGVGTDNLQLYLSGTATGAFNITNSTFTRSRTHQINLVTRGSAVVSELDITGNTIDYVDGLSSGIFIDALGSSNVNYNITGNARIHAYGENAITVAADDTAFVQGRINNNRDAAPGFVIRGYHPTGTAFGGITVVAFDQARNVVLIDNNELQGFNITGGISLSVQEGANARIDATITNNVLDADPAGIDGFPLDALNGTMNTVAGSSKILCLDARSNVVTGEWTRAARLRMFSPTGALITGFVTDFPTTWAANGNSVLGTIVGATSNGGTISGTATCNTVSHPVASLGALNTIAAAPSFNVPASVSVVTDDGTQLVDLLSEALGLGGQTAHAQGGSFNLPLGPIAVGTIPAGSSVTVTFAVPVNAVIPPGTSSVALQAIISGSNFGGVLSDDPETAVNRDTTLTPLDALQAVQTLPETGEDPWWQDVVIWGVRLAILAFVLLGLTAVRRRFFRAG